MAELVRLQLSPIFRNFRGRVERLRDDIVKEGGEILRREEESSIRLRWYDTGRTVDSLQEEIVVEGDSKFYRLTPTAVSKRGAPYLLFGEYGTGKRGRATGRPAPKGYEYGNSAGMRARRYSRIAVGIARPQIVATAKAMVANFTV